MARVIVTSLADADTAEIIRNLDEQAGASVATRYIASFDDLYSRLAQFPDSGALRPKLGARVRVSVVSPYIVICERRQRDDTVVIMRVLHGRRKISRRMLRPSLST